MGDILKMSQKELDRLEIIQKVIDKRITQKKAAQNLDLSYRQMKRLVKSHRKHGAKGIISKKREKPSNRKFTDEFKTKIRRIVEEQYADFGPTFAAEKLEENHQVKLSKETLRKWMMEWDIWKGKEKRHGMLHQQRVRRSCFGELIQIDGSPHDWFEGRGKKCCLIVFTDDATSKIVQMRFFPAETTLAYLECVREYIQTYGRPLAFYSDRHGIFRINTVEGIGETQYSRAMKELRIKTFCAPSPQAKGRVERANRTLQDRLVKELRLKNISDIKSANRYTEEFREKYNRKFGKTPASQQDAHRKAIPNEEELDIILCHRENRKISKNLELSFKGRTFQINLSKGKKGYSLRQQTVQVCCLPDDQIKLWYKNRFLDYRIFERGQKTTEILSSKEIGITIDKICEKTKFKPDKNHPWKRQIARLIARKNQRSAYISRKSEGLN